MASEITTTRGTTTTASKNIIRLVVISDTHGHHRLLDNNAKLFVPVVAGGGGDVLIHCGDFCNKGSLEDAKDFGQWITNLRGYKEKLIIDGNHDRYLNSTTSSDIPNLFQQMIIRNQQQQQQQQEYNNNVNNNDDNDDIDNDWTDYGTVHFLQDDIYQTKDGLIVYGTSWKSYEIGDYSNLDRYIVQQHHHQEQKRQRQQVQATTTTTTTTSSSSPSTTDFGSSSFSSSSIVGSSSRKNVIVDVLLVHSLPSSSSHHGKSKDRKVIKVCSQYNIPLVLGGHFHKQRGTWSLIHHLPSTQQHHHTTTTTTTTNTTIIVNAASLYYTNSRTGAFGVTKPVIIDYNIETKQIIHIDCEPHPSSSSLHQEGRIEANPPTVR